MGLYLHAYGYIWIMYKTYFLSIAFLLAYVSLAQKNTSTHFEVQVDSLYREDQIYLGVSFNILANSPQSFAQNDVSWGVQAGFLRDMPINKRRNLAVALGIGWSYDIFHHNLRISEETNNSYAFIDDLDIVSDNRFTLHQIEFPFEFRWRSSTPQSLKFWRIYAGGRIGYVFRYRTKYLQTEPRQEIFVTDTSAINRLQYGAQLSMGYGAFSITAYYGLQTLFNNNAIVEGELLNLQVVRIGLQFYFL